jgi:hypothetical protein
LACCQAACACVNSVGSSALLVMHRSLVYRGNVLG